MCLKRYLTILFLFMLPISAKAQSDQTLHVFINHLMELRNNHYDSVKAILYKILTSDSIINNSRQGPVHFALGELLIQKSNYDSADWHYKKSLKFYENKIDNYYLARVYVGLGYVAYYRSNNNQSLDYNLKAEKIFRELQDQRMLGRVYKRMGDIFYAEKNLESAKSYFFQAKDIAEQLSDSLNLIRVLNSLSSVYDDLSTPQKSEEFLQQAIDLGLKINCIRCLAISYSQLGINYHFQGRYKEAIELYWKEYGMNKLMGASFEQFYVYQNISAAYHKIGNQAEALNYANKAAEIGLASNILSVKHDVYKNKHRIFKAMGKFNEALVALELQMIYKDSLAEINKSKVIEGLRAQYEDELKLQRINELEQGNIIQALQARTERQVRWGLIVFMVLFIVLLFIIYNRYRHQIKFTQVLDEKNTQLYEAKQFRDRMFAIISHDLKSPLSSFSSITSTLFEYYDQVDVAQAKEYLRKMSLSAKSLEEQLKNLLEWAMSQLNQRGLRLEKFSLAESFRHLIEFYRLNIDLKEIQIYTEISDGIILESDKEFVHTILRNLISNAIKFTPKNGSIFIKACLENDAIKVSIKDSGIGIAKDDIPKLFSMQVNKLNIGNSPEKGTGLGLVIVKELLDQLGGSIRIESDLGKGTKITFILPQYESLKAA